MKYVLKFLFPESWTNNLCIPETFVLQFQFSKQIPLNKFFCNILEIILTHEKYM